MAVKKNKVNFRVVLEPKPLNHLGGVHVPISWLYKDDTEQERASLKACADIVDDIKRHVDGIANISVDYDTEETCEHCGRDWKPDNTGFNGCCDKELVEWEAKNPDKVCKECGALLFENAWHKQTCSTPEIPY